MLVPNRNFSSPEYRYGFNGMEKDDEIKGGGNSYNFGARIYDNRIGRWIKTDPLEIQFPYATPYNFANNSPILYIDIFGEKPIPITSFQFRIFANKLGIFGNKRIGEFFERLVVGSLKSSKTPIIHNTRFNFYSDIRNRMNNGNPSSVRPDALGLDVELDVNVTPRKGERIYNLELSSAFYEAKVTSATITKKYRKGQITGMIDVLSQRKSDNGERSTLILITTTNTKISNKIKRYAAEEGVRIMVSYATIDDETGEFVISDLHFSNVEQFDEIERENHGAGVQTAYETIKNIFDTDEFSDYDPVNPIIYTKGLPNKKIMIQTHQNMMINKYYIFLIIFFSALNIRSQNNYMKKNYYNEIVFFEISNSKKKELLNKYNYEFKKIDNLTNAYFLQNNQVIYEFTDIKCFLFNNKKDYLTYTEKKQYKTGDIIFKSIIKDKKFIEKRYLYISVFPFNKKLDFKSRDFLINFDKFISKMSSQDIKKFRLSIIAIVGEYFVHNVKNAKWGYLNEKKNKYPLIFTRNSIFDPISIYDDMLNSNMSINNIIDNLIVEYNNFLGNSQLPHE